MLHSKDEVLEVLLMKGPDILDLMKRACEPGSVTYSRNIFIPLTRACRNRCGYCTFRSDTPEPPLLEPEDVMGEVRRALSLGCTEALFTFGEDAHEFPGVRDKLESLGFGDMTDYTYHLCELTLDAGLLPHTNMGVIGYHELRMLKEVNASMGLMLESASPRLMETEAHRESPGKDPRLRIKMIEDAGRLRIPFTTGLLIGIGETLEERAESLLELRRIQDSYGHIQEIIIQNFRSKPGIPMENQREPSLLEMVKMVAVAKIMFPDVSIQVPPNLNRETGEVFLLAGADDWGGVSPISRDYVNPEAPWPEIDELKRITESAGFALEERLPVYRKFISREFLSSRVMERIEELYPRFIETAL